MNNDTPPVSFGEILVGEMVGDVVDFSSGHLTTAFSLPMMYMPGASPCLASSLLVCVLTNRPSRVYTFIIPADVVGMLLIAVGVYAKAMLSNPKIFSEPLLVCTA